jgi:hypothetical protein
MELPEIFHLELEIADKRSFPLSALQERVMLKMACEICGRAMLPASLKVHMSTVHKNPPKVEKPITQDEIEVISKMKRAAATK